MKELLEPLVFRNGVESRNRVTLAAMASEQSHLDGTLSEDDLRWLEMRAAGGFGIVTTCATYVSKVGQRHPTDLGIFSDAHLPGLTRLATAIRKHGALPMVQIWHGGYKARQSVTGIQPWSASDGSEIGYHHHAIAIKDDGNNARAGTEDDIQRVIGDFAAAAHRAHQAGMAGVEIHGAHGYLITQFLSMVENRRKDAWGGSLEGRARLAREIVRKVRSAVPDSFVIGMRISPESDGSARGLDLDESLQLARWLCDDGIDFLHASLRDHTKYTAKRPQNHALQEFRKVLPHDIPILAAGLIWTREEAEKVLGLGADAIALGRAAIVNPDWPNRVADPQWQPRRPPVSPAQLQSMGANDFFIDRLRWRPDFVS